MSTEDKYAIALGVLCVVIWGGGTLLARPLAAANPRVIRIVWPVMALTTMLLFGGFVLIARLNAH